MGMRVPTEQKEASKGRTVDIRDEHPAEEGVTGRAEKVDTIWTQ